MGRLLFAGGTLVAAEGSYRADVVRDPVLPVMAPAENRHGNVDHTPCEGMTVTDVPPTAVCVCGNLVYRDGEVVGERGSRRLVERSFAATGGMEVRV